MGKVYVIILIIGSMFIGALAGAIYTSYLVSRTSVFPFITNSNIQFTDFVGILLACIAIILTVFGVFLAVLAVYGFSAIQDRAVTSAENGAVEFVETAMEASGTLNDLIKKVATDAAINHVKISAKDGELFQLITAVARDSVKEAMKEGGELYLLTTDLYHGVIYRGIQTPDDSEGTETSDEHDE